MRVNDIIYLLELYYLRHLEQGLLYRKHSQGLVLKHAIELPSQVVSE